MKTATTVFKDFDYDIIASHFYEIGIFISSRTEIDAIGSIQRPKKQHDNIGQN